MARKTLPPSTGDSAGSALSGLAAVVLALGVFGAIAFANADTPDAGIITTAIGASAVVLSLTLYVAGTVLRFLGRIVDATEAQQKATEEMLRRL